MNRIISRWPGIKTENYIELVDLKIIDQAFKARHVVLLSGVEGSGKTTLAIEYAKWKKGTVVVWFAAESARKIDDSLQRILAADLKLDPARLSVMQEQERFATVVEHVRNQVTTHMFVFDDIDMPKMTLFPDSLPENLYLLLTSSSAKMKKYAENHDRQISRIILGSMEKPQAEKYFYDRLKSAGLQDQLPKRIFDEMIHQAGRPTPFYLKSVVSCVQLSQMSHQDNMTTLQLQTLIKEPFKYLLSLLRGRVECEKLLDRIRLLEHDQVSIQVLEALIPSKAELEKAVATLKQAQIIAEFTIDDDVCYRLVLTRLSDEFNSATINTELMSVFIDQLKRIRHVTESKNKLKAAAFQRHIYKLLERETPSRATVELYERLITIEELYNLHSKRANDLREKRDEQMRQLPPPESPRPRRRKSSMSSYGSRSHGEFTLWDLIKKQEHSKLYQAYDTKEARNVAIKVVDHEANKRELQNVMKLREITIQYVVKFYGYFVMRSKLYIIMQLCQHGDLKSVMNAHKLNETRINEETVIAWSRQLALVLVFLNKNNIIHNDIKPENILIDQVNNCIKLADVGEAIVVNKYKTTPALGYTHAYTAPERLLSGGAESSTDTDVWSAAIVFYELIYLKEPFEDANVFIKNPSIHHEESTIGQLFRPIFDKIFIILSKTVKNRMQPSEIFSHLHFNSKQILSPEEHRLARQLDLPTNMRIQGSSIPNMVVKNHIDIMNVSAIEIEFTRSRIVMLKGVGGSGKSTLVSEYARKFVREKNGVVVWFNALNVAVIDERLQRILVEDLFFEIERVARMNERTKWSHIFEHVRKDRSSHLFVFDSIGRDGVEMLGEALSETPMPDNLSILLTFEAKETPKLATSQLDMSPITAWKARQYLDDRLGARIKKKILDKVFDEVIKPIDDLTPFHLEAVVASIEMHNDLNKGIKKAAFPALVEQLKSVNISDYVLNYLKESRQILELTPFLDADQIALDVVKLLVGDAENLRQGLVELKKYQIVQEFESEDGKQCIRIHKLIVQSMCDNKKLGVEERNQMKRTIIVAFLNELDDAQRTNKKAAQRSKMLQNHMIKLLEDTNDADENTLRLYEKLIMIEKTYNFNYKSAIERSNKLVELKKAFFMGEPNHESIAASLCDLGDTLRLTRDFAESTAKYSTALQMYLEYYKGQRERAQVARCLEGFAMSHLDEMKELLKAVSLFREALWITRQIHATEPTHPDVATGLRLMGIAYERAGRFAEARELYSESLSIYRLFYKDSPCHVTICVALNCVAEVNRKLGDHAEAVKLFKASLKMSQRVYSDEPDHPDIAAGLMGLAAAFESIAKYSKALKCLENADRALRSTFKDFLAHPQITVCSNAIKRVKSLFERSRNQSGVSSQ